MVAKENVFSPNHLLEYAESLIRISRSQECKPQETNYSWLKAKTLSPLQHGELQNFLPVVQKLTAESRTAIAVTLDSLSATSADVIKCTFEKLLEEQYNKQLMEMNVKRAKNAKQFGKKLYHINKVHPVLFPPGRAATVSFILDE